jgi:hypothetical protein
LSDERFDIRKQQVDIAAKLPQEGSYVTKEPIEGSAKVFQFTLALRQDRRWYLHQVGQVGHG